MADIAAIADEPVAPDHGAQYAVATPPIPAGPAPMAWPSPAKKAAPRVVIVSSRIDTQQAQVFADALLEILAQQGRRVAVVDAGSRLRTAAGVSDLAAGRAGYADVIQFDAEKS